MLLTDMNYSLLPWLLLRKSLEMANVETPSNRATSANNIPDSFTTGAFHLPPEDRVPPGE
jgi:hypothetical protein